jgi:hypothetical protein
MHIPAQQTFSGSRTAVRSMTLLNFLVFVLFVIPPAHRWVDRGFLALRSIHCEEPVGYSLEIWLVGSTLAATALLARMIWQRRKNISAGLPSVSLRLEKTLVAAWWLAALGACAYGFTLGMGAEQPGAPFAAPVLGANLGDTDRSLLPKYPSMISTKGCKRPSIRPQ